MKEKGQIIAILFIRLPPFIHQDAERTFFVKKNASLMETRGQKVTFFCHFF